MIRIYSQLLQGQQWLQKYRGCRPVVACILGFTATGLIPGISAAGAKPKDRQYTAIADAEFLLNGVTSQSQYPLPPLDVGISPVLISRAVVETCQLPLYLFNAGLPQAPAVPAINLGGVSASCLTTGAALPLEKVSELFQQGLDWGEKLATVAAGSYLILSECVVGGTTTALSLLTSLGIDAVGKVNSSHPSCNHAQKWQIVQLGLQQAGIQLRKAGESELDKGREKSSGDPRSKNLGISSSWPNSCSHFNPLELVAAVGDPMQIAAAGMVIAASRNCGVLLAGGTQMLAVYALARALVSTWESVAFEKQMKAANFNLEVFAQSCLMWRPTQVVVGTTSWVAQDPTGDTVGLAREIGEVPLLATELSFAKSCYSQLRAYEQGYVKEGVGAGGCTIAAHLYKGWRQDKILQIIEDLVEQYSRSYGNSDLS